MSNEATSTDPTTPDTIVLIHGFWVTPRSWEHWIRRTTRRRASRCSRRRTRASRSRWKRSTPTRRRSRRSTVPADHRAPRGDRSARSTRHRSSWATRPAASFTQILLDHGFGAAGVAINSAPTEGVPVIPLSQLKATFPVLKNPANRHRAVGFTPEQWHYAFTNTFDEEESLALYERYHIPASGRVFWGTRARQLPPRPPGHLGRLQERQPRAAAVHLRHARTTSCRRQHPAVQRQALQGRAPSPRSRSTTARTCCRPRQGWEQIADDALDWALAHTAWTPSAPPSCLPPDRRPHHPHRRADHADRGRSVDASSPIRPSTPPAGPTTSAGARRRGRPTGPAVPPTSSVRSTSCCSPTIITATTSTRPAGPCSRLGGHVVITTLPGANVSAAMRSGSQPWDNTTSRRPDSPPIEVTATPCRHGPAVSQPIVGDVIGFALRWHGQENGALWISGDTVLYDGVRHVADRLEVDIAMLHLGAVQFGLTGPVRYTMTAREAIELLRSAARRRPRSRSTTRAGRTSGRIGPRSKPNSPPRRSRSWTASPGHPSASRLRFRSDQVAGRRRVTAGADGWMGADGVLRPLFG